MTAAPPGWYPDATAPGTERWWDGSAWSPVSRPAPAAGPTVGTVPTGPSSGRATATPDGVRLAGPGARLLARVVDALLVGAATALVGYGQVAALVEGVGRYLGRVEEAVRAGGTPDSLGLLVEDQRLVEAISSITLLQLLVSAAYTILLVRLRGATLGKAAMRLRVRGWAADGLPTWRQSVLRWLTREGVSVVPYVGSAYTLLDALWLLWDPRRQCLHDKLPATVVVSTR